MTEICPITKREKVEGSDGIKRVPCDRCGSADEPGLERPAGSTLFLCSDCYDIITDLEEILNPVVRERWRKELLDENEVNADDA